jgi:AbiV family abortive infection protein
MQPKPETVARSISASVANGKNLLADARLLFDWDRFSTALALAVLAQEEFAKAFILRLISDNALPWIPEVMSSIVRHKCKHLLALVMEWLPVLDLSYEKMMRDRQRHDQGGSPASIRQPARRASAHLSRESK